MRDRERLLNLPGVVSALLGAMAAIQLFVAIGPRRLVEPFFDSLAFIPLRLSFLIAPERVLAALGPKISDGDGGEQIVALLSAGPATWLTPFSYAFLHGGWTHLMINALTLAAFGAPVAKRLGPWLFLWFFMACALAGALTHLALHPLDLAPVVGASAAISGTMAAIVRFAFTPGARLGEYGAIDGREARTASLSQLGENRQAIFFLVVWFGANFLFGAFPEAAGSSEPIAWEAHIGGFLFGLFAFGAFERLARRR
ncbi:MAG: rhomboid family intramembrane serine protease [Methylocystis sp.]|uniref:rhomboid family intramembrane serine protease n=1 Tax=Methylocystis sp. TaxID=1911079 RepID=UPI003DA36CAF